MLRPPVPDRPTPTADPATDVGVPVDPKTGHLAPLVPGSVTARALWEVWSGSSRAVVVDSPPGAGKSTAAATIAAHLAARGDLKVVVAAFTRQQAFGMGVALARQMDPRSVRLGISGIAATPVDFGRRGKLKPHSGPTEPAPGQPAVGTVASLMQRTPPCDVLIVDEGYQITWGDLVCAADQAAQIVVVGDPGQIGPVVTVNTAEWNRLSDAPHRRSPEVLRRQPDTTTLTMDVTHRFGAATVEVVSPLYPFGFRSARPATAVDGLPEVRAVTPAGKRPSEHAATLMQVAELAADMVGRTLRRDGDPDRQVTPADIAVVVSRNVEMTAIRAALNSRGMRGTTVGTADKLQGGEWTAVVALDPLVGAAAHGASPHSLSLGRLCVMLTRHRAHVTLVTDPRFRATLEDAPVSDGEAGRHVAVRDAALAAG